jgi:hypothetical protein
MCGLKLRTDRFNLSIDLGHGLMQALPRLFQLVFDSLDVVFHFVLVEPRWR